MAIVTMIMGQSGTGKSASLRNLDPDTVALINVSGKSMPFRGMLRGWNTDDYQKITAAVASTDRDIIVIDDASYLMVDEYMRTAKVSGYQKFTDMALNFFSLIRLCAQLPAEKTVYFLGHLDTDANGGEKFKTIGRLLDEKVTLEGLFTIVLKTMVQDGHYYFSTRNSGQDTVKSPMGMFGSERIENDLAAVDAVIREYYGMPAARKTAGGSVAAKMAQAAEAAKAAQANGPEQIEIKKKSKGE